MPKYVTVAANPAYKPKGPEDAEAFKAAKAKGEQKMPYVTAFENVQRSGGMYLMVKQKEVSAVKGPNLEHMPIEDLKVMMLQMGVKTEKQMRRSDIVRLIQAKLDSVEVIED